MPKLSSLLSVGHVAPLCSSMSSVDVYNVIGTCEGKYEYKGSVIEKHGQFQLEYRNGKLVTFNWLLGARGESKFQVTESVFYTTTTVEEFLDYCDEKEISWRIDENLSFDRQLSFSTCESVNVTFDLDQRELQKITIRL